jgi:hypothetical protein
MRVVPVFAAFRVRSAWTKHRVFALNRQDLIFATGEGIKKQSRCCRRMIAFVQPTVIAEAEEVLE